MITIPEDNDVLRSLDTLLMQAKAGHGTPEGRQAAYLCVALVTCAAGVLDEKDFNQFLYEHVEPFVGSSETARSTFAAVFRVASEPENMPCKPVVPDADFEVRIARAAALGRRAAPSAPSGGLRV